MSFDFSSNINPPLKAQAAYKDGGGMGGGGMYFKQGKRKDQPEDDLFEFSEENDPNEINFSEEQQEDVPTDTMFNKFVNWFRIKKK